MKKTLVAIVNGLVNPIPPVKGGGPQIVIYNTCKELYGAPFDWRVLSLWDPQVEDTDYDRDRFIQVKPNYRERACVAILKKLPYRLVKGIFGVVRSDHLLLNLSMVRNLKNLNPDLIIVHESYALTYLCHLFFPQKKIILYHHSCKMHIDLTQKRWKRLVRSANAGIIAINAQAFYFADEVFSTQPADKYVILNGVNQAFMQDHNTQEIRRVRGEYSINSEDFVFLYAGRIHPMKGLDLLIDAFVNIIKEASIPAKLLIVGAAEADEDGSIDYERKLREKANKKAGDSVKFFGYVPNYKLMEIYVISNCGVLPTKMLEGNSLFLMECLAMGLPVIATHKGGIPEVVRDGSDGFLINEHDLENTLYETMLAFIKEKDYWAGRKDEIASSAKDRFSYNRVADELCQVIETTLCN